MDINDLTLSIEDETHISKWLGMRYNYVITGKVNGYDACVYYGHARGYSEEIHELRYVCEVYDKNHYFPVESFYTLDIDRLILYLNTSVTDKSFAIVRPSNTNGQHESAKFDDFTPYAKRFQLSRIFEIPLNEEMRPQDEYWYWITY